MLKYTTNPQERLHALLSSVASHSDLPFLEDQFSRVPFRFKPKLIREYGHHKEAKGRQSANLWSSTVKKLFGDRGVNYAADDDEIVEIAANAARDVRNKTKHFSNEEASLKILTQVADRYEVELPPLNKTSALIQRMVSEKWWRRQLRKQFQKVEAAAIGFGFVHKRAGLYASDETVNRRLKQRRKNAKLMESLEAINDHTGQICTLAELAATNVSNPAIRRTEMMTRIRGMEEFSNMCGFNGLFLTLTTPSRMHARRSGDGSINPKYNDTSPGMAQRYLLDKVWAPVMAKLKRQGLSYFGVRVVEPHHDGTPHWHILVFVNPEHQEQFTEILRTYALRDSPDEHGAQEHRFTVTEIDPSKGSAAGYVAKYIAKNIDGFSVGDDYEADTVTDASETSVRVEAWASM